MKNGHKNNGMAAWRDGNYGIESISQHRRAAAGNGHGKIMAGVSGSIASRLHQIVKQHSKRRASGIAERGAYQQNAFPQSSRCTAAWV